MIRRPCEIERQSRNRGVGEQLGLGRTIAEVVEEMNQVAEGVKTARVVMDLAAKQGVLTASTRHKLNGHDFFRRAQVECEFGAEPKH